MKDIYTITDEQFDLRVEDLKEDIETKKNFVCDHITEADLFDYLQYEVFKGDFDKLNEALVEYYKDDYNNYCDDIISSWFEED